MLNYIEICIQYPEVLTRQWSQATLETLAQAGLIRYEKVDLQYYYSEADLQKLLQYRPGATDSPC